MEALFDALLYIVIIGTAVIIAGGLLYGIANMISKVKSRDAVRHSSEAAAAVKLYRLVTSRSGGNLTLAEYDKAVRYTIRKYHMASRDGTISLDGKDLDYIAELVSEAVGQARLTNETLEIARNDRELESDQYKNERNETA